MTKAKTQKSTVDSVGAQIGKKDYEDVSGTIAEIIAENRALKAQQAQEVDVEEQVLRERDWAQEKADQLADAIQKITGGDIGEHSNYNCPYDNALKLAHNHLQKPEKRNE